MTGEHPNGILDFVDLQRRLSNIVRYGAVAEVDLAQSLCRVAYADGSGGRVLTGWLPWWTRMAGEDSDWRPPEPGETAAVISPDGELASGFVLAGFASDTHPAPDAGASKHVTVYRDGARIEYDHETHALSAVLPAGGSAAIEAPDGITITGDVAITGDLGVAGGIEATGDISADLGVSDKSGSMQQMRTTYNGHVHGVPPAPVTPVPAPAHLMN